MNEISFEIKEVKTSCGAVIKAIGVGGCGSNMINRMIKDSKYTGDIEMAVANTDIQDLNKSSSEVKIQMGKECTGGRGAGAKPEVGLAAAQESEEEIKAYLKGADLIFLAVGLGGGTGTGAAPFIARLAKELNILVVGIATMPEDYERRTKRAKAGLEEFKKECDSVILVQNELLKTLVPEEDLVDDSLKIIDNILIDAVESMLTILLTPGDSNVDFADVSTIMTFRGLALIGSGFGEGSNAVSDAFSQAFNSPLLDLGSQDLSSAKGLLTFVKYGKGITYRSMSKALAEHTSEFDEDIEYIPGSVCDSTIGDDQAYVIVMLTGFDDAKKEEQPTVVVQQQEVERIIRPEELFLRTGTDNRVMSVEDYKKTDYSISAYHRQKQD